jgi:uroporphyrinogen-III synthase
MSLQGRTVALAEGRQQEELAGMLEGEGAAVIRCPLVNILDVLDPSPVVAWLQELTSDQFHFVVFFTGEGVRRLLDQAERARLRPSVLEALRKTRIVTRGPKPVRALRDVGLTPTLVAQSPTTEGVIEALRPQPLRGQVVGVQLYSEDNPPLRQFLDAAGAAMHAVLPYRYAPAADASRVAELIRKMERAEVDWLIITSSPQVERLFEVAEKDELADALKRGLERVRVAAIGPVAAAAVRRHGGIVTLCPEQGFVMKNLVQKMKASDT